MLADSSSTGAPIIGDNCYIGVGAKLIGGITIGNNVRISANYVVYESVPDNHVVVSGKQMMKEKKQLDNRFFTYRGRWVYFPDEAWHEIADPDISQYLSDRLPIHDTHKK